MEPVRPTSEFERLSIAMSKPIEISYESKANFVHKVSIIQLTLVMCLLFSAGFAKIYHSVKNNNNEQQEVAAITSSVSATVEVQQLQIEETPTDLMNSSNISEIPNIHSSDCGMSQEGEPTTATTTVIVPSDVPTSPIHYSDNPF